MEDMTEKIYLRITRRNFIAGTLSIYWGDGSTGVERKVLILSNIIAFKENNFFDVECFVLDVRTGGSVFGLDMSLQLKSEAYELYPEIFLFANKVGPDIAFRALAEKVELCDI